MSHPPSRPPAHPGSPPRRSRRSDSRTLSILLAVLGGALLLVLVTAGAVVVYQAGQRARTGTPVPRSTIPVTPRKSASPTPTATPTPTPSPSPESISPPPATPSTTPLPTSSPTAAGPNPSLAKNSIYRIDLDGSSVSCGIKVRNPKPPLKNGDLAPYLRTVVDCLVKAFKQPLAAQGFTLSTPKVKVYRKTVDTPCGTYGQKKAPAYYCAASQTIYWPATSDDGNQAYTFARLGYVALTAHEFGHHLQAMTGMLNEYGVRYFGTKKDADRFLLSRRLELQAQCFEGVFLDLASSSIKMSRSDVAALRTWHSFTGDEDPPKSRLPDHGTSAAQVKWLETGLDTADFGRCNTWVADNQAVK